MNADTHPNQTITAIKTTDEDGTVRWFSPDEIEFEYEAVTDDPA